MTTTILHTLVLYLLITTPSFNHLNIAEPDTKELYESIGLTDVLDFKVFNLAISGSSKIKKIKKRNISSIIDYTKPSTSERLFVIDIQKKQLLVKSLVAHGKNSGENYATSFSNTSRSLKSCIGFFITAETYYGKHGYSLRLDGLEKGINDNSRSRAIVIHGADYVSQEFAKKHGRLGRSWGCPALPNKLSKDIIDVIAQGSCLFIYAKNDEYFKNSKFIEN